MSRPHLGEEMAAVQKEPMMDYDDSDIEWADDHMYHDLFLQQDGMEFMQPILFEDGMDFVECELYYQMINSQCCGGAPRRLKQQDQRQTSPRDPQTTKPGALPSCIRKSKLTIKKDSQPTKPFRRCSFSGLPARDESEYSVVRSNSLRGFQQQQPRVSFDEYVQVVTIHTIDDYPQDVRCNIWMTREEMMLSIRRAMAEDAREKRKHKPDVERQPSTNNVIDQCLQEVEIKV